MDLATIAIKADTRDLTKLQSELGKVQDGSIKTERTTDKLARGLKVGLAAAAAAAAAGIVALGATMTKAIGLANEQEKAETKLAAVLKATGEAAGFNIDQLKDMASGMQAVTTTGDEVILNAMAILGTFKEVRGEGFERATMAALDMSAVMGQDLNTSILQIGKALNDPIKGMTALTRSGVSFTEQQKEQVRAMQESGDMMGAQNLILAEMETQFGGTAKAMRGTFSGMKEAAGNAFGDMLEQIGFLITKNDVFIDLIGSAEQVFISWGAAIERNRDQIISAINKVIDGIKAVFVFLRDLNDFFKKQFGGTVKAVIGFFRELDDFFKFMIGNMLIGWENFKHNFQLGTLAIKSSFFLAFDAIGEKAADVVDNIGERIGKLPLVGDKIKASFDGASDGLRNASNAAEEYEQAVIKLNQEHEIQVKVIKDVQDEIFVKEKVAVKAEKVIQEAVETTSKVAETASKKVIEYTKKELEAYEKAADGILDSWEIMHRDRYKVQSRYLDNEVRAEEDKNRKVQRMEEKAEEEHRKLMEKKEQTVEKYTNIAMGHLSSFFSDLIDNEFKSASDAWDALWKSMLKTLVDTVAQMAVQFVVGKIVTSFFHEGDWNLKSDEYNAVLQTGEMVIPREEANELRDTVGSGNGVEFDGLIKAARMGSAVMSEDTGRPLTPLESKIATEEPTGGLRGLFRARQRMELGMDRNTPLGLSESREAQDRFGIEGMPSNFEGYGRVVGRVLGGAAGMYLGAPMGKSLGRQLGADVFGTVADMIGDLMNARDFESIRDAVEDGTLSQAEGKMRIGLTEHETRMFGVEDESNMRSISEMANVVWSGISNAAMAMLAAVTGGKHGGKDKVNKYRMIFGEDAPGSGGGHNVGGDLGTSTGTGGGYNSPGAGGDVTGLAKGGMVTRLMVPQGDDGIGGLKFGERVLSVDQNKQFENIVSGNNQVPGLLKQLIQTIKQNDFQIAKNTQDIKRLLQKFDIDGLELRT